MATAQTAWFNRLGIQRRIMAYACVGLILMFGVLFYLGMQAVRDSTDLVFQERLGMAQSVAATLSRDFSHVVKDAQSHLGDPGLSDAAALEERIRDGFAHLAEVDDFAFLRVTGVRLLDTTGNLLGEAPDSTAVGKWGLTTLSHGVSDPGVHVMWTETPENQQFVLLSVPLADGLGRVWARALVSTAAANSPRPPFPFGLWDPGTGDEAIEIEPVPGQTQYDLEVLTPSGTTILGVGRDHDSGGKSEHYPLVRSQMAAGGAGVLRHKVSGTSGLQDHVMAVVPVPDSDLYVILEQDDDAALALPITFRRRLIVSGTIGFVFALLVVWVTTRHVVKPTEKLTAEAVRMAQGNLSTPIQVRAQDEIGVLAENLEIMRRQLKDALEQVQSANRELESRVQARTRQLRDLVGRVLTAQEEERRRIALELHDDTAQALAALTVTLDSVARRAEHLSTEEKNRLREARQIAAEMIEGIRRLINALRPVALEDMGLAAALRSYADDSLDRAGVAIHVDVEGLDTRLPGLVELALYRIGQEAVNNVARHARAKNVWIALARQNSLMRLTVRDDGVGFDTDSPARPDPRTGGLGLAGMQERANLVGGSLTIQSVPGQGTTVRMEVPTSLHG